MAQEAVSESEQTRFTMIHKMRAGALERRNAAIEQPCTKISLDCARTHSV
jgi:hypothetical protein